MRILFDQGVPKPLQAHLKRHAVTRAYQLGWSEKKNGELLALAQTAGFEMLVTTDQRLRYQQNLSGIGLAVFILGRGNWPEIEPHLTGVVEAIDNVNGPGVYFFPIPPGSEVFHRVT